MYTADELEIRCALAGSPRADELIACLEGEIAKRDEELAACRVAVENCEVFRAQIVELEALSVTKVMLDIVPGDGDGYEVYAKSVSDVETKLGELGEENEELQFEREQLRAELADATAIIDGLRGENEALHAQVKVLQSNANSWQSGYDEGRRMGGKHCALTIDQQAQRIGELEGLLRDSAELIKHGVFEDGYCCCGSSVDSHGLGDGHSPVDALAYHAGQVCERIEAALSAGKDSDQ